MNKYLTTFLFILMMLFISCGNSNYSINGKWQIDGVGSIDSANTKDNILVYGVMTMLSNGAEFEFTDNGNFNISYQGTTSVSGSYIISADNKTLTLKANNTEETYELTKSNEKSMMLKSKKDASVVNLKKD